MTPQTTKYLLSEDAIPTHWVNLLPDLPGAAAAAAEPADGRARRPGRPDADLPDGADRPGGLDGAGDPDPGRRPRRLPAVAADAAVPRAPARAGARHPRAHLLQVRGHVAGRPHKPNTAVPQAYENAAGRHQEALDRDRRGPVGLGARVRLHAVRARVRGLHGRLELRPEALPPLDDADVGRDRAPLAERPHRGRALAGVAPDRLAGDRDLRGGRGRRPGPGVQLLARLGAQPRAPAPDRDRPGGDGAARAGGGGARRRIGCVGGGSNFGGLCSRSCARGSEARIIAADLRPARR